MSKKKTKEPEKGIPKKKIDHSIFPLPSIRYQWIAIVVLGFTFYANSLLNNYALDDQFVILMNKSVSKGISGIPHIFSSDIYEDLIKQTTETNKLAGGRYRPLSIATYAIDQQFFGGGAMVRHLINVLLYCLSLFFLLQLLSKYIFPQNALLAFFTTLLFTIHPIHTEVVANVKSRDEILSFLFIILTFIQVFKYRENKKASSLLTGLLYFFLALLSKEYAVTLLLLIPVSLYLFSNTEIKSAAKAVLPYFIVFVVYIAIRLAAVGFQQGEVTDILNNPYFFATAAEKWASKIFVLLLNLKVLLFPYPLSADYGYQTIAYRNFASLEVWLSVIVYGSLIVLSILLLRKKHPMAFAILIFLSFLFLVSNFVLDIGATMGERLLYHSSLGVVMVIAFVILFLIEKLKTTIQNKRMILYSLSTILIILCGIETISRNKDWKDDASLWIHDVTVVPNSALANNNAGTNLLNVAKATEDKAERKKLIEKVIGYLKHAHELNPGWLYPYLNLANAYIEYPDLEKAEKQLRLTREKFPDNQLDKTYFSVLAGRYADVGNNLGKEGKYGEAIQYMEKALSIDSTYSGIWYSAGGAYFVTKQYDKAKIYWEKAAQLAPDYAEPRQGLAELKRMGY